MKKTTRFLAIVLAVILALSCFSAAFADYTFHFGNIKIGFGDGDWNFPTADLFNKLDKSIKKILVPSPLDQFTDGITDGMEGDNPLGSLGEIIGMALDKVLTSIRIMIKPESILDEILP